MDDADFHLRQLSARERFDTWRKLVEPCFTPTLPQNEDVFAFDCAFAAVPLSDTLITQATASAQSFQRSMTHLRTTGWDHIMVQHYTAGGFVGEARGREVRVEAGDINFFDLGRTLATTARAFSNTTFLLPRERLRNLEGVHGLVLDGTDAMSRIIAQHMEAMARFGAALNASEADAALEALTSMIARARIAEASRDAQASAYASVREVVTDYIDKHLGAADLDIATIAGACRISRATLYRLFAGEGGIAKYILAKRLDQALRWLMLQTSERLRVGDVSYRCGFANDTHFSRVFRQRFGISPREARQIGTAAHCGEGFHTPQTWIVAMRRYRAEIG